MGARVAIGAAVLLAACAGRPPAAGPSSWRGSALRAIPAQVAAVVVAGDLQAGLEGTGLGEPMTRFLGGSPAQSGLDPRGVAGAAILEPASGTVALFATAADPPAVLAAAERIVGPGVRRARSGEAVLVAGDRATVVVRGRVAVWVQSAVRSRRDLWAVRIAGLPAAESLDAVVAGQAAELAGPWLIAANPPALLPETPLFEALGEAGMLLLAGSQSAGTLELRGFFRGQSPALVESAVPRLPGALDSPPLAFGLRARPATAAAILDGWLAGAGADAEVRPGLTTGHLEVAFTERGPMLLIGTGDPEAAAALARQNLPAHVEPVADAIAVSAAPGLAAAVSGERSAPPLLSDPVAGYVTADGSVLAQLVPWPQPPADDLDLVGPEGDGDFPLSEEYRQVEARVLELQEQHLAGRVQLERLRQQAAGELGSTLGAVVAVARRDDDRTRVQVRFDGADPAAAVAVWRRARQEQQGLIDQLDRLAAEHAEAVRELIRLRLRDVTREQRRREQGG